MDPFFGLLPKNGAIKARIQQLLLITGLKTTFLGENYPKNVRFGPEMDLFFGNFT